MWSHSDVPTHSYTSIYHHNACYTKSEGDPTKVCPLTGWELGHIQTHAQCVCELIYGLVEVVCSCTQVVLQLERIHLHTVRVCVSVSVCRNQVVQSSLTRTSEHTQTHIQSTSSTDYTSCESLFDVPITSSSCTGDWYITHCTSIKLFVCFSANWRTDGKLRDK